MSELVHRVREAQGDPQGALVLNHGRGADENDLFGLLDELDPERRFVGVTTGAPLTNVPPGGRHWYLVPRVGYPDPATFASSYEALTRFVDGFLAERELGWDQTVIGGFSMGAVMSYAVSLGEGRPVPAGLIAWSGFVPTVEGWAPELEGREGSTSRSITARTTRSSRSSSRGRRASSCAQAGSSPLTSRRTQVTGCRRRRWSLPSG